MKISNIIIVLLWGLGVFLWTASDLIFQAPQVIVWASVLVWVVVVLDIIFNRKKE